VDEVVDQDPPVCENCGELLEQEPRVDAFLRQVTETPWYKAFVKEFRLWLKACPKCGIDLLDWLTRALQAKLDRLPAPAFRG
jgi:ribosomal protein S27AE